MAGIFKYKVDSSVAQGTLALQQKLNSAGGQGWELVIADDSGVLVYKDSSPQKFEYKVETPPIVVVATDLENYLNMLGSSGWDLVVLSVQANVAIFKRVL